MKCQVCKRNEAKPDSIVCSENCNEIRLLINKLLHKYTPTNGCDNCWGDLGSICTNKCKQEFKLSGEFINEIYSLVELVNEHSYLELRDRLCKTKAELEELRSKVQLYQMELNKI